jgi:hypothetical protein
MKKPYLKILLLAAIASVAVLSSCRFRCKKGSGDMITENRKVAEFSRLDIAGGFKVKLVQDSSQKVTITADDNLMKYIETEVSGDKLTLKTTKNICSSGEITVLIGVRHLQELEGSGAVDLSAAGPLNIGDIRFHFSGATKVDLELNAGTVNTEGTGSTEIKFKGQAGIHNVEMTGSGNLDALDFVVGKYSIKTTGAAECKINVLNSLSVNTTGASDIEYRGNPKDVNTKKTGASSVKKID